MANFAMQNDKGPKAKKFAVLYDVKNDYSVGLAGIFRGCGEEEWRGNRRR